MGVSNPSGGALVDTGGRKNARVLTEHGATLEEILVELKINNAQQEIITGDKVTDIDI